MGAFANPKGGRGCAPSCALGPIPRSNEPSPEMCDSGACSSQLRLKLPVVRDLCAGINKLTTEPISFLPDGP
ncbi:hypothetical protein CDL15_Pgr013177 [Punica granatum]|uniref:Uncharacterized protein n=1 Tax=Punica granatum TaxID=22663 RepID=A0A218XL45_PUNGR|nr:hypothetical protein CDL15_Pgr013177 [Punica granatum]